MAQWAPRPAVSAGNATEFQVSVWLAQRGWAVQPFGATVFDPRTPAVPGVQGVQDAVHSNLWPIRWAPDLIAGSAAGPVLVEVSTNTRDDHRLMPIAKMTALDAWAIICPVFFVDASHQTAWQHIPHAWAHDCVRHQNRSTGNPYVTQYRTGERPLDALFGAPTRGHHD